MRSKADLHKELEAAIDTAKAKPKWIMDPLGYFTIKPFPERGKVFVRYYDAKHNKKHTFSGTSTTHIVHEIVKRELISRLDHAAYLGKEIEKAIIALNNKLDYVQDSPLTIK